MNCPACLSLMINSDEIHKISPTKNRMNLHCNSRKCPSRNISIDGYDDKLYYGPFMQVITNDPSPWECVAYGLIIMKKDKPILIEGNFTRNYTTSKVANGVTRNFYDKNIDWKNIRRIDFVQLSTDNDMHIQALALAEKLTKLIAFI